ncbi:MAG TPA: hypothetical protein PK840_05625 [Bacilli bacterium]|nr:hypothetical protein [Bacilli bacterium]
MNTAKVYQLQDGRFIFVIPSIGKVFVSKAGHCKEVLESDLPSDYQNYETSFSQDVTSELYNAIEVSGSQVSKETASLLYALAEEKREDFD